MKIKQRRILLRYQPSQDLFLRGVDKYDGNNTVYFEALRRLEQGWGNPVKMADAIWPVLRDWHAPFYRWGAGDPHRMADRIESTLAVLDTFHLRAIATLCEADEPKIRSLFRDFSNAAGRTNAKGFQPTTVGAAKSLHLLCPHFFPLWDNEISNHYRCEQEAFGYVRFCWMMNEFAGIVREWLPQPDDRSVLKRIDEFNYAVLSHPYKT